MKGILDTFRVSDVCRPVSTTYERKMFDVFSKFDETFGHDMCSTLSLRVLGTSQVPKVPFFGKCVIEASFFRGRA